MILQEQILLLNFEFEQVSLLCLDDLSNMFTILALKGIF